MLNKHIHNAVFPNIFSSCLMNQFHGFSNSASQNILQSTIPFSVVIMDLDGIYTSGTSYNLQNFINDLLSMPCEETLFVIYERKSDRHKVDCKDILCIGITDKTYLYPMLHTPKAITHGRFCFYNIKNYLPIPSSIILEKALDDPCFDYNQYSVAVFLFSNTVNVRDVFLELCFYNGAKESSCECCDVLSQQCMSYEKMST